MKVVIDGIELEVEEEKVKSAYALNLCTVSVSQIVDYDDLNILEQEYDAILNNLNLEKIIKDPSLLDILKQILDTITYFKMEDIERKIIEKEYQQQMKNAIWSSVPNFGMIVAGGSPITMAISLASQVGIGYMNYRKNKNQYAWDKEKKELKLQQAALEQLNGLRRELFTTAWTLAKNYDFPDKLRLTEKQIKQYNEILRDPDPISKCERLGYIKANFQAYPPFWYHYGSTANYIANSKDLNDTNNYKYELTEDTRKEYKKLATDCFVHYGELDKLNILREDQITASWALEYADILIADKNRKMEDIIKLIKRAKDVAPNSYDVLELCIMAYLRIDKPELAKPLLRFLVNEDYNKVINGQLLSSIYVKEKDCEGYDILITRVGSQYLFPMPEEGESLELANAKFIQKQRVALAEKYSRVIDSLAEKYSIKWNKIHSVFDYNTEYDDSFFLNSQSSEVKRLETAAKLFSYENSIKVYNDRLSNCDVPLCMRNILWDSIKSFFSLPGLNDEAIKDKVIEIIKEEIVEDRDEITELLLKAQSNEFKYPEYVKLQDFSFNKFYSQIILNLKKRCNLYVKYIDEKYLMNEEGKLRTICSKEGIQFPEIQIGEKNELLLDVDENPFAPELFGTTAVIAHKKSEKINDLVKVIKEFNSEIQLKDETLQIYIKGDNNFDSYFYNPLFNNHADIKAHAIAVFKDFSKHKYDLIFTVDGIASIKKNQIINLTKYKDISLDKDKLILYNNNFFTDESKYYTSAIESTAIYGLIKKLIDKTEKKLSDCLEFVEKLDGKIISDWFKAKTAKYENEVKLVVAYPNATGLSAFGFNKEQEVSSDNHVIQFVYDVELRYILAFRIIKYKFIDTNLQANIEENNGISSFHK